uniref:DNA-directed DNA polymerase n=1 Tax=Meloidogyne hapla TaxID=6305 RepID=A0A1I8BTM7_MELHA
MDRIVKDKKSKLLYTDTDSCFYMHKRNKKPPFRVGDMLGMMSRKYEEWCILSFYTGGCKQYALKMKHRESGEIKYIVKCRGCWEQVDTPLDFNQFKVFFYKYILRYAPIYDKGLVDANLDCYPYGYRANAIRDPTD